MTKTLRVAVLSASLVLLAAPLFADGPGGWDPPPPPTTNSTTTTVVTAVLTAMGL